MAVFIKTTIMGQVDKEPSASHKDLPVDIKKWLLGHFSAMTFQGLLPSKDDI